VARTLRRVSCTAPREAQVKDENSSPRMEQTRRIHIHMTPRGGTKSPFQRIHALVQRIHAWVQRIHAWVVLPRTEIWTAGRCSCQIPVLRLAEVCSSSWTSASLCHLSSGPKTYGLHVGAGATSGCNGGRKTVDRP
jgi:hypothetical protein